ncbi:uncharacterized protein LOC103515628 [Diaphorina citri]|uniref:Uncharacterized protein LOC103515628 n=1 Tax=Diaphorina citri TaxID=121845 RepID=A0A3Q0J6F5_DIACI|nr:uncharacterized protein LOC103515628 [Diaphorina citri]
MQSPMNLYEDDGYEEEQRNKKRLLDEEKLAKIKVPTLKSYLLTNLYFFNFAHVTQILKQQVADKKRLVAEKTQACQDKEDQLKVLQAKNKVTKEKLLAEKRELELKLKEIREKNDEIRAQKENAKDERQKRENERKKKKEIPPVDNTPVIREELQIQYQEQIADLKEKLAAAKQEISVLVNKHKDIDRQISAALEHGKDMSDSKEELLKQIEEVRNNLVEISKEKNRLLKEKEQLKLSKMADHAEKGNSMIGEIEDGNVIMSRNLKIVNQKCGELKKRIALKNFELGKLKDSYANLLYDLKKKSNYNTSAYGVVQGEIDEYKKKIEILESSDQFGNIPYEATEEKLKDIFSEAGPVISFKLVYDRETGKPKGYGFCEYKDQETALSAMRNLNGYEIGGRNLRVDNACTEKSRLEIQSLLQGPISESQYGEPVSADKAPENVSKAVASLPPEQMFELMKQMMQCAQNNPAEARAMLLQNPQLAYALLQALVVMRVVDPQAAATMLHQSNAVSLNTTSNPQSAAPSVQSRAPAPVPPPSSGFSQDSDLRIMDPRLAANPTHIKPQRSPARLGAPYARSSSRLTDQGRYLSDGLKLFPPHTFCLTDQDSTTAPASNTTGQSQSDKEKAALIMQVLQLTDEQISMLPPEQRQSILVLKEQIAKAKRT